MKISQILIMKATLVVLVAFAVFFTVTTAQAADKAADTSSPLKQCYTQGTCELYEVDEPVQCRTCAAGKTQTWKCHNDSWIKKSCNLGNYIFTECVCGTYWKSTSACGVCLN